MNRYKTTPRFDYEYVRKGTANLFTGSQPLVGWRTVFVTGRRTAVDLAGVLGWPAEEMQFQRQSDSVPDSCFREPHFTARER